MYQAYLEFPEGRGSGEKSSSIGEVWIFSGIMQDHIGHFFPCVLYKKLNRGFNSNLTMNILTVTAAKPSDMKFHVCDIAQLFP